MENKIHQNSILLKIRWKIRDVVIEFFADDFPTENRSEEEFEPVSRKSYPKSRAPLEGTVFPK